MRREDAGPPSRFALRRPGPERAGLRTAIALVLLLAIPAAAAGQTPPGVNACLTCHRDLADQRLATPARLFSDVDVHRERGFGCVDCHGGSAREADAARAHDRRSGFRGAPSGADQIKACARCHSNAELMRTFSPRQRVDQETEYATSIHGKRLAGGDQGVATCASCHHAHGIRLVADAKSPVFPANVAGTCSTCHASADHMRGRQLPGGSPLPTTQLADYQKSVHYAALTTGNDLSAPTCNDCHGNHGAAPPGVGAVTNVCGTCHAVFAQKFATSVHAQIFERGCVECHGNHAVFKPSDEMLSTASGALCAMCHEGADDNGVKGAAAMRRAIERLKTAVEGANTIVNRVGNAGIEVGSAQLTLAEARTHLTLARTEVHGFDPAKVESVVDNGLKLVGDVDRAGDEAAAELAFRRRGLALSLGAILLFVGALALKIRQLERTRR
jgi:predicted CXXCH cytochrome family protein